MSTATLAATPEQHYLTEFTRLHEHGLKQQPAWVQQVRQQGMQWMQTNGFPKPKDEDWKYTPVKPLLKHQFAVATESSQALTENELAPYLLDNCGYRLVFANGYYQPHLSAIPELEPEGVVIANLQSTVEEGEALLGQHLGRCAEFNHGFTALNNGLFFDGAVIRIPVGIQIDQPLHLLFIATTADTEWMSQIRNVIIAEAGSQVDVVEHYVGLTDQVYCNNAVTEVSVAEQATVNHYKLQQESSQSFHIGTVFAEQQHASTFNSYSLALGGRLVRSDTRIQQKSPEIHCLLNGLYFARNKQHIDHHTFVNHAYPAGKSDEFYKGIVQDKARVVFNGRVIVQPDAQQTNADQINKNLVLSEQAEVDTKPELEIYVDDVRCSHGATVGQLDEKALFYLRTRGIPEEQARQMLMEAFAQEVIDQWPLVPLRQYGEQALQLSLRGEIDVK